MDTSLQTSQPQSLIPMIEEPEQRAERLSKLQAYKPNTRLSQWKKYDNRQKREVEITYYPAAWRIYELQLRYPFISIECMVLEKSIEKNLILIQCRLWIGPNYEQSPKKATGMKQGLLSEADKIETLSIARAARNWGIGTEHALDTTDSDVSFVAEDYDPRSVQVRPHTQEDTERLRHFYDYLGPGMMQQFFTFAGVATKIKAVEYTGEECDTLYAAWENFLQSEGWLTSARANELATAVANTPERVESFLVTEEEIKALTDMQAYLGVANWPTFLTYADVRREDDFAKYTVDECQAIYDKWEAFLTSAAWKSCPMTPVQATSLQGLATKIRDLYPLITDVALKRFRMMLLGNNKLSVDLADGLITVYSDIELVLSLVLTPTTVEGSVFDADLAKLKELMAPSRNVLDMWTEACAAIRTEYLVWLYGTMSPDMIVEEDLRARFLVAQDAMGLSEPAVV